jgi:hypothetical protein
VADRRADRRANAGRPDKPKPVVVHGAPLSTPKPKPPSAQRPKAGPADEETRRREIERRVQEGKDASEKARDEPEATTAAAPKPAPTTIGKPGRSTIDTLRDRGKDTDEAVEREQ